jgi:hypothetical protein
MIRKFVLISFQYFFSSSMAGIAIPDLSGLSRKIASEFGMQSLSKSRSLNKLSFTQQDVLKDKCLYFCRVLFPAKADRLKGFK